MVKPGNMARALLAAVCCTVITIDASDAQTHRRHTTRQTQANRPLIDRIAGLWVWHSPRGDRFLTIRKDLGFDDSKIKSGTLVLERNRPGVYSFIYDGSPKCRARFVPVGNKKLLLNDDGVGNPECIIGMLERVNYTSGGGV